MNNNKMLKKNEIPLFVLIKYCVTETLVEIYIYWKWG